MHCRNANLRTVTDLGKIILKIDSKAAMDPLDYVKGVIKTKSKQYHAITARSTLFLGHVFENIFSLHFCLNFADAVKNFKSNIM